jgi:hypothetical protein
MSARRALRRAARIALSLRVVTPSVLAVAASGCRGCASNEAVVAELADLQGAAMRSGPADGAAWGATSKGATFSLGDAVRTEAASTAKVDLAAGGALRLSEKTVVRFLAQGATVGARRVHVETGEAEVESGGSGLDIDTAIGQAQIEPGARVRITATASDARFQVLVGRAEIDADGGVAARLEAGQRFTVSTGAALLDPSAPAPTHPDAGTTEAGTLDGGGEDAGVAVVTADVRGAGVRVAASKLAPLVTLAPGAARLAQGARLVVPDGASVEVSRGDDRIVVTGQADVVVGHDGGALVEAKTGRVMIVSPSAGARVDVPGGSIVLAVGGGGNAQAQVSLDRGNAHVVSNTGQLELRGRAGVAVLTPGQSGTLDGAGVAVADVKEPSAADVTVPGGESPVVHSPRGAAAVRIRFDGVCAGDALVDVGAGQATRTMFVSGALSAVVVPLAIGLHRYRVRCVDAGVPGEAKQAGTIQLLRDSGAAPLPRSAPHDFIDADGRKYSVLYQNVLPQITVRWPHPPDQPCSLHLERGAGKVETIHAPSGTAVLPAGAVEEGSYRLWFDADADGATRSPDTTLKIAFDNAAPAAEVQQPVDGQAVEGTVHVAGIALEGASVSVNGVAVQMDPEFRFRGDVPAPAGDRSIAIRIAHPLRGVHYYLRTLGGA